MWQYPPQRILVAIDFGQASERALRVAAAVAARHGSAVTALHAETLEVPPYFTHDQLKDVERHRAQTRREAQRYLEAFVRGAAPSAAAVLVDGPAVEAVLAAATSHDLLVLGTHGRKGPSRWWMGSVAERLVRDSPVPALVVRAEAQPTPGSHLFARPVAVAGPEFSGEAHSYAHALAGSFGGEVAEKAVSSLNDLKCDPVASLMVVATGRHHGGGGWFGDTAERLVRSCALPMLFVPSRG
jgi:nucleotide-binding universal stress UspA family protein